jgi:hypothetical protein
MSWRIECGIATLALDSAASLLPVWQGVDVNILRDSLLLHSLATMAVIPLAAELARSPEGGIVRSRLLLLLLLAAALPLLGATLICCLCLDRQNLSSLERNQRVGFVAAPAFRDLKSGEERPLRLDETAGQLKKNDSSTTDRMRALMSIQHVPLRASVTILRQLLADSADDVRLLAYGLLDRPEKEIMQRIEQLILRQRPGSADHDPGAKAATAHELAELHWELVYQGLVQGTVRQFCLDQIRQQATMALRYNQDDAGLWLLLGRAKLLAGDLKGAAADFGSAAARGMPRVRVAPYLAELAFLHGDYAAARHLLQHTGGGPTNVARRASRYWGNEGNAS